MDGMISLVYAVTHPGRVARPIIVDSTTPMLALRLRRAFQVSFASDGVRDASPRD